MAFPADKDLLFSSEHIFSLRNQAIKTGAEAIHKRVTGSDGNLQMAVGFQSSIYEGDLDDYRLNWYSEIYIVKYTSDNSKRFFPKVPIIRLSEMYLIAAEASGDKGYLQTLRDHRGYVNYPLEENCDLAAEIEAEYRKEFMAEGQLFYYYKRLDYKTLPDMGVVMTGNYVFPMPDDEMEFGDIK